jgi:hypothetical protein
MPPWKPEEDAKLKSLVAKGFDSNEIAKKMGKTYASINSRRRRIGVPSPHYGGSHNEPGKPGGPWTPVEDSTLARLLNQGVSNPVMCATLKRTQSAISKRMNSLALYKLKTPKPLQGSRNVEMGLDGIVVAPMAQRFVAGLAEAKATKPVSLVLVSARCVCRPNLTVVLRLPSTADLAKAVCPSCHCVGTLSRH